MSDHDQLLTETIANHFDAAVIDDGVISLGIGDLHMSCRVEHIHEIGSLQSASLYFWIWGGKLGPNPIFASASGYDTSPEAAIIVGACNWAGAFAPVLTSALAGADPQDASRFEVEIEGRRYQGLIDRLDRTAHQETRSVSEDEITAAIERVRNELGGNPWILPELVEHGRLPALPREHACLLSLFVWESADQRVVEIKVNGADWAPSRAILDAKTGTTGAQSVLLRELAVLVPEDPPPPLLRKTLARTLDGVRKLNAQRHLLDWPGYEAKGGQPGAPLSEWDVARLERELGRLPASYRRFLLEVQGEGPGPGYGLLSPLSSGQLALAQGVFDWQDGSEPQSVCQGVLLLAHAGCGVAWLLVLSGNARGEVWLDSTGSDRIARRVASSFEEWYASWLDAVVRDDELFAQWDARYCATPSVLGQVLESLERDGMTEEAARNALPDMLTPNALGISCSGSAYFARGETVDPCQTCVSLVRRLGLDADLFKPGVQPQQGRRE